jgi:glycosyltransferase involved in cell wall biosynthesis
VLSGVSFACQALAVARRERPALVQGNDWNTMWCALAIKLTCGARVVYDTHELWSDRNGRWEWRWWLIASEALFVRAADAVIAASPGYADALAARYRVERPTTIRNIPEGGAPRAAGGRPLQESGNGHAGRSHNEHTDLSGNDQPPGPCEGPVVVYVGGVMPGRGLEQTIDALALAPQVRLRAVGPGAQSYRASLIERAAAAGVGERLEIEPPVPPAAVASVLKVATAGLCLFQPMCRSYELGLPNKLFEYAAAGVPMLASDLPVMGTIVREERLGEVVPPNDPGGIAAGLRRLCEPGRWDSSETEQRVRAFAQANNWDGEAQVLAGVYTGVLALDAPGAG